MRARLKGGLAAVCRREQGAFPERRGVSHGLRAGPASLIRRLPVTLPAFHSLLRPPETKVAYLFTTQGHIVSYKLAKMIWPQRENGAHGVRVVGLFSFEDNN